jgi:hypothetical protein
MDFDFGTLCILGFFALMLFMVLPRLMGGGYTRGPHRPQYDDPNIDSGTGFGSTGENIRPQHDDPNIGSRSGFGRAFGNFRRSGGSTTTGAGSRSSNEPTRPSGGFDSPDVGSRSGFGRKRK